METLSVLLAAREHERARTAYSAQLLWQMAGMLFALAGGEDFQVPDYFTLFPPRRTPGQRMTAEQVRRQVLREMERRRERGRTV